MLTISGLGMEPFDSIGKAASSAYSGVKSAVTQAKDQLCKVTTSQIGQVGISAVASAYGVPPQTAQQSTMTYNAVACGQAPPQPAGAPASGGSIFSRAGISSIFAKIPGAISNLPKKIARFNTSRGVWSVYARTGLSGMGVGGAELLGGACIFGDCGGLGAEPDPAVPAGYSKEGEAAARPADAVDAGLEKDKPFYKKWQTYALGAGALAVLGAGYWYFKK